MERFSALKPGLFVILTIAACSFGLAGIGIVPLLLLPAVLLLTAIIILILGIRPPHPSRPS